MEIHAHNTIADYRAFYEEVCVDKKKTQKHNFYQHVIWYLSVLALAAYVAFSHDEIFIGCIIIALAFFYLINNWSFARNWEKKAQEFARAGRETSVVFEINPESITEVCQGIRITVPWAQIREYSLNDQRLILHYSIHRGFILPSRFVSPEILQSILEKLKLHKAQKKAAAVTAP